MKNKKVKSPKRSFKGWKLRTWASNHKQIVTNPFTIRTLKELLKIVVSFVFSFYVITNNPALDIAYTGIGKLILDSIEYFFKEY